MKPHSCNRCRNHHSNGRSVQLQTSQLNCPLLWLLYYPTLKFEQHVRFYRTPVRCSGNTSVSHLMLWFSCLPLSDCESAFYYRCHCMLVLSRLARGLWSANSFFAYSGLWRWSSTEHAKPQNFLFFIPIVPSQRAPQNKTAWTQRTIPFEMFLVTWCFLCGGLVCEYVWWMFSTPRGFMLNVLPSHVFLWYF